MANYRLKNNMANLSKKTLITSVEFIFVGALIWLLDFKLSFQDAGGTVSFDILHDLVGMLLITFGLNKLRQDFKFKNFQLLMASVLAINIFFIVSSIPDYFPTLFPKAIILILKNLKLPFFYWALHHFA